ncbi:MAG TPA: flagellar biosynthetic protein FliO [Candidatus Deferrimicrobiaceae bacterium]|jgi:flagellar biogenesis protein FliO
MIRRAFLAAFLMMLAASLAAAPCASAKSEKRHGKARPAKASETSPAAEPEPAPKIAFDNAAPAADNAARLAVDNAAGASAPIRESDVSATVVTGKPLAQPPAAPSEGPSFAWAAVKMVIALGIVLAMLLGISHFMKKYMDRFGAGAAAPGRAITVTEARSVAPKTQVMVIEALGSRYLVGVTPTQVTLIDKVPAGATGKVA